MKNNIENNKLIAEFLGHKINWGFKKDCILFLNTIIGEEKLLYDKRWDWLMEVVEKIDSTKLNNSTFAVDMYQTGCQVFEYGTYNNELITTAGVNRMDATYKAVVEFIKWYNEIRIEKTDQLSNKDLGQSIII